MGLKCKSLNHTTRFLFIELKQFDYFSLKPLFTFTCVQKLAAGFVHSLSRTFALPLPSGLAIPSREFKYVSIGDCAQLCELYQSRGCDSFHYNRATYNGEA